MPIRPIRNDSDYETALDQIEHLMDLNPSPNSQEADELDVLVTLVRAWEDEHYRLPDPPPVALLQFLLDQQTLTRKDLESALGSSGRVSEILSGNRSLSAAMLVRLHDAFGLPLAPLVPKPRPEVWLDLRGPGRASARAAIDSVSAVLASEDPELSERVDVRAVALDDARTTRVILEASSAADLDRAEALVRHSFRDAVVDRRQVAWPSEVAA